MRKPVMLMAGERGSRHFGTEPYLTHALRSMHAAQPSALYIGVASGDDATFGGALCALLASAGASEVLWPKISRGEIGAARAALERVQLVLIGGGDVDSGMRALREAGLVEHVRAAASRGAAFMGISAGSIMLGERWIRWPHERAGDDEAETFDCLHIAPCALDTHGEGDGWSEARAFATVRARELNANARAYGVPSGAALLVQPQGELVACGAPVVVFVASPRRAAALEGNLPVGA